MLALRRDEPALRSDRADGYEASALDDGTLLLRRASTLGETLELTHRAHSRDSYARGALLAAKFLADRPPGRYSMNDVLGI